MRNPKRMQPITAKLLEAWSLVPDWRLCQLISNLHGSGPQDIFHTEDTSLEDGLDRFIAEYKNQETD